MAPPPPPPQWVIDLSSPPAAKPKSSGIPDPPGFTSTSTGSKVAISGPFQMGSAHRFAEATGLLEDGSPRPSYTCRDGHIEAQEGMGGGSCSSQATANDSYHDVHVRQLPSNIQHHDGGYGI